MKRLTTLTFLFVSLFNCVAVALAQDPADPRVGRVDSLFAELNRTPPPGHAVAVVRDGRVLLRKGYGFASIEHRVPITPSTVFDAASLAKQVTGLAVAMLVSEGKIKLGDDIRTHVPGLPDLGRPITVAHLLHHTSGLRDWTSTLSVGGWRPGDVITSQQILTMAVNQRTLNFTPGAEHFYSNTGYNLLAEMIHKVTGRPFHEWAGENIFRPLGMVSTHFRHDHTEVIANRASGYEDQGDRSYRSTPNNLAAPGSSSLFTTADDMARWVINFHEGRVGGQAAMSLMRTRGALNDGTAIPYAFGIEHGSHRGLSTLAHAGSWASFNSYVVYFPQQKFGVVVLANSNSTDARDAAFKIANIYLEKELAPAGPWQHAALAAGPVAVMPQAVLDEYAGLYRLEPGRYVRIKRSRETLTAQATNEFRVLMSPRSEREFWVPAYGAPMVFHRDAAGKVTHLELRNWRAPRVDESVSHPPAQPSDYAGVYESEELDTIYRVVVNGGSLELQHRRLGAIPLALLWGEEFGALHEIHWFVRSVEFKRGAEGRVTGLVINGDRGSRDIRLVKRR